ncbi:MAG: trigger factor [Lachnospiraceae bacterium]|nr:trigger factor [Lachnospiraceae bacterium]
MSVQVEKLEHNMAKLTIEAPAEDLEKSIQKAYQKLKGRINIPGFRKGKAPRQLIEKMYGPEVFYEDAANDLIYQAYASALDETEEEIVSRPKISVTQLEKGKPFIFTAEVALKPEVELGKYKGVKVTKTDTSVSDSEVEEELKREQKRNGRQVEVTDRPVKMDDIVNIDYAGTIEGVPFEGGTAQGHRLTIGSHQFIDNFEDQIVGKQAGEEFDVTVTFPEDYHAEDLQGEEAVFHVKLNTIWEMQLPELDDQFAEDYSEYSTLEEYRDAIRERIGKGKENEAKAKKEDEAIKAIVADSNMDIPDAMIETEAERLFEQSDRRFGQQGLSMEQYMNYTGMTKDMVMDQMKAQARINIESRLVLQAVAKAEDLQASDEEVDEEIGKLAEAYRMEADQLKDAMGDEELKEIRRDVEMRKAADLVVAESKETEGGSASKSDESGIEKKAAPKKKLFNKKDES